MNLGRTAFSQLIAFLPDREFRRCVARHGGDTRLRGFSCWDQFLCLAFAQFTYRESLRDIEACLRSCPDKLYHMGIRGKVSRSTLADANEAHDWHIFADFAQHLITRARALYADDPFGVEIQNTAYALNSNTIDLCLALLVSKGDEMAGRQLPACGAESAVNAVDRARPRAPVSVQRFCTVGGGASDSSVDDVEYPIAS